MVRIGWRRLVALIGLAALLLPAACAAPGQSVTLRIDGMRFTTDTLRVRAGEPVTLHLINRDGFAHSFDVDALEMHVPLAANATVSVTFTPPAPGRYDFYCGSPGHMSAGMVGTLVVE